MWPFRKDAWLRTLERSLAGTEVSPLGDRLPGFPPDALQIQTVGLKGKKAVREAHGFMETCVTYFQASPHWARPDKRLLDFGVGWGRIARTFLRDVRLANITGADVNADYLDVTRAAFRGGRFIQIRPFPPLRDLGRGDGADPEPAGSVDFITAYSVFSHLSGEASLAWVEEFARILSPGGMAALTTRARWFFDRAEASRGPEAVGYAKGLGEMFDDFAAARARYDAGELVHANTPLIGDGQHYGETFIPEAFARREFGRHLEVVAFHEAPGRHPIIILRKRS